MLLCCSGLKQLLRESLPLRFWWQNGDYIPKHPPRHVSFLLCLAGKEVSLASGNASGGFMLAENIPLLWEFSTGKQWRHDIPFSMLKWSKGIKSGQNPVSLFSRCSSFMHWDFPISTSHGWTQAIQDKISPLSGWKNSHECVKTVWEHPRSSLRSLCILRLMENLLPSSLNFGAGLYMDFSDQQWSCYTLLSWLSTGGWPLKVQGVSCDSTN